MSLQQEVRPGFGLSTGFYHTDFHNTQVAVNTALSASSFDFFCLPVPGLTGARKEYYNGGELALNWRFRQSGLLAGASRWASR